MNDKGGKGWVVRNDDGLTWTFEDGWSASGRPALFCLADANELAEIIDGDVLPIEWRYTKEEA